MFHEGIISLIPLTGWLYTYIMYFMAGPNGVYVCPHITCGFTTVKESVLNGHVVVMHQLGQDLTHSSGSEVEFSGYGEGA